MVQESRTERILIAFVIDAATYIYRPYWLIVDQFSAIIIPRHTELSIQVIRSITDTEHNRNCIKTAVFAEICRINYVLRFWPFKIFDIPINEQRSEEISENRCTSYESWIAPAFVIKTSDWFLADYCKRDGNVDSLDFEKSFKIKQVQG